MGGNTFNSNVDVTNNSTGNLYASYAASGSDNYNANATFTKSSSGGMFLAGYNATVYFKGDVTLNNISTAQQSGSSVVVFTGTAGQTLTQSSGLMGFNRITVNKASNNLTLGAPLTIGTALTLTSGKIISTSTNLLTFADNATVSGASNSSYVEGPVAKTGNDIFTFPIGKSGTYRPLGISAPASTATIFTADYIPSVQTAGSSADTSVTNLSTCEHWLLSRSGSSSNVNVTLSWNSTTCNRASALNMRVSGWSGSSWTNHGNGARTGNSTAGTVTSSTNPSAYNVFALSNKTCTATAAITPSGATTFCAGNAVTLTATAGAINYLWSTTAITQAINATTSATYTINLTDTSGCNGIANQVVTVHANPVANAGTDTTFCSFNTVNLGGSPSASSGTPGYSYTWSPADYLDNAFGANPNFNGIIGSQYVLEVSDANGCLDKDTVQVTVNPGVLLNGGGSKTVCAGSGVVIGNDIAILSGIGPYTYSWSPNTNLDDDTIATPLSTPVTSTTYTVEITDANGCQTTKDVNVTVAPLVNAPRKKITAQRNIVID
ncbi:MAG: hypothetical protein M0D57_08520 [Sphingobacteriales bacterium JAD_PAG50586_3]|nr:MAG: hypothetical protein M0D57_08520 [Sphingobacteriales bacterium JAD_PAG50586_3]